MVRRVAAAALATVLAIVSTGCGTDTPVTAYSPQAPGAITGRVTVFAAASLTGAFTQLGKDFESTHPGVTVRFNFAGSSALAQQLERGAPADVFASAAPKNMDQVSDAVKPV